MVTSPLVKPVTVSLKTTVTGIGEVLVGFEAMELIVTVGAVLSTPKVEPVPPSVVLPAESLAEAAAMDMPSVPSPVMPEMVTVLEAVPVPEDTTVPVAVPDVFKVI
jgi:hypothetical protein